MTDTNKPFDAFDDATSTPATPEQQHPVQSKSQTFPAPSAPPATLPNGAPNKMTRDFNHVIVVTLSPQIVARGGNSANAAYAELRYYCENGYNVIAVVPANAAYSTYHWILQRA